MMIIDNVTVLGTGVLGSQIAYQTAYSGFEVTAYDISDEILETARKRCAGLAARYEQEAAGASGRARGRRGSPVLRPQTSRRLHAPGPPSAPDVR